MMSMATQAAASELEGFKPRAVGLELEYYDTLRDPYTPEDNGRWKFGTAMNLDLQLASWYDVTAFYAPTLHFRSTESQVRHGGLYYELGLERSWGAADWRVYRRHHSQHVFERDRGSREYPLLDSWVVDVRWNL